MSDFMQFMMARLMAVHLRHDAEKETDPERKAQLIANSEALEAEADALLKAHREGAK